MRSAKRLVSTAAMSLVVVLLGSGAAQAFAPGAWPSFQSDAQNTGAVDGLSSPDLAPRWVVQVDGAIQGSIARVGDHVFLASWDGTVYALDAGTGRETWRFSTGSGVRGGPAVESGRVFVGSTSGTVYALEARDGSIAWERDLAGAVGATPAVLDDRLLVGTREGIFFALDTATGEEIWSFPADGPIWTGASAAADLVVFGTTRGTIYALDTNTGLPRWVTNMRIHEVQPATPELFSTIPAIAGNAVFIQSDTGGTYRLDAATGAVDWLVDLGTFSFLTPTVSDGSVLVAAHRDTSIRALDVGDGSPRWDSKTDGWPVGSVAATREHVVVPTIRGSLHVLDAQTGDELGVWNTSNPRAAIHGSPIIADGAVYIADDHGRVYMLGPVPANGTEQTHGEPPAETPDIGGETLVVLICVAVLASGRLQRFR